MTVPHERTRAINWGSELLHDVAADVTVPDVHRDEARALQAIYPTPEQLAELIAGDAVRLPVVWAGALLRARNLFDLLWRHRLGSVATREGCRYTLRHFPEDWMLRIQAQQDRVGGCLLPEDFYR